MIVKIKVEFNITIIRSQNKEKAEHLLTQPEYEFISPSESFHSVEIHDKPIYFDETSSQYQFEPNEFSRLKNESSFEKTQNESIYLNDPYPKHNEQSIKTLFGTTHSLEPETVFKLNEENFNNSIEIFDYMNSKLSLNYQNETIQRSIDINKSHQLNIRISKTNIQEEHICLTNEINQVKELKESPKSLNFEIEEKKEPYHTLSNSLNRFASKLFSKLTCTLNDNYLISPLNVSIGLAMLLTGAQNDTENELKSFLEMNNQTSENIICFMASKLNANFSHHFQKNSKNIIHFSDKINFYKKFIDSLFKIFNSTAKQTDLSDPSRARNRLDDSLWNETELRLRRVSPVELTSNESLILMNAFYLRANWKKPFKSYDTKQRLFHLSNNNSKKVFMMEMTHTFYTQYNPFGLNVKICQLEYSCGSNSMTIILPNKGIAIEEIEAQLNYETFQFILNRNNSIKRKLFFVLPKFKIVSDFDLKKNLKELGLCLIFDSTRAEFNEISPDFPFVSNIFHNTLIEIDEKGTEAFEKDRLDEFTNENTDGIQTDDFICDRPFIFIVHDIFSLEIIFIGKFIKPKRRIDFL